MRRIAANTGVFALALSIAGSAAQASDGPEKIALRATSSFPPEVQAELAKIGEPKKRELAEKQTAEYLMRHHCGGSFTDDYRQQVADANPGLSPFEPRDTKRTITLPPCPHLAAQARVTVFVGDDLASLLHRELGARPDTKVSVCPTPSNCTVLTAKAATAEQMKWTESDLDTLRPETILTLPFSSRWVVIALKDGIDAKDAMSRLLKAAKDSLVGLDLLHVEKASPLELIGPLTYGDDPALRTGNCSVATPIPSNWPFDQKAVAAAIADGNRYLDKAGFPITHTVIRITDTGINGIGARYGFPETFLAANLAERHGERRIDRNHPKNGFTGDKYGIDPDTLGNVEALRDHPERMHGSHVADLALGGRSLRDATPSIARNIKLNFARIIEQSGGGNSFQVNIAAVGNSFSALPQFASIVNLSLGGPSPVPTLREKLKDLIRNKQIAVIAAGNDGAPMGPTPMFPASYSKETDIRPATLVVGAHGPNGMRTGFSNYGRSDVDLLAPGCLLPDPFASDGEKKYIAGTSFAAPLVSFTAALLRSFLGALAQEPGGGVDADVVKTRLRVTSRYVNNAQSRLTRFGGILDIPAALRVFDDVIRMPDGRIEFGRWLAPDSVDLCEGATSAVKSDWILRVRIEKNADGGRPILHVLRSGREQKAEDQDDDGCTAATDDGPELLFENGKKQTFKWSDIATFIPAYASSLRRIEDSQDVQSPPSIIMPVALNPNRVTSDQLSIVQKALADIGLYTGTVDGRAGPLTETAIRAFQVERLEQPSGVLTQRQVRALID